MSDTLQYLQQLSANTADEQTPFGGYEEQAIISLALDLPQFFTGVSRFLKPSMFARLECRYVIATILNQYEKYNVVPSRDMLRETILNELTEGHPYDDVITVIDRKSDYREVPIIKDTLLKWAKDRAFGLLYSDEATAAYARGDYGYLDKLLSEANRIADITESGFWFFENYPILFEPNVIEHRTTGFPRLDRFINNGGPSPKEVLCWMAPTNVGKSILLCNNAISSVRGFGDGNSLGQDVLFITFELDAVKTAMRCLGAAAADIPIDNMHNHREYVTRMMTQMQNTYQRKLLIVEWAPEECSVAHIYALLDNLKRTDGWRPGVVILDYMDLMISKVPEYNKDDYTRQKHVANEIRGLAKNENVVVFTATQTNRSGIDDDHREYKTPNAAPAPKYADLNKAAESFAKQFALDYVVSLNQTKSQRSATPPRMTMYIAKNRNGPKHETVNCTIRYETMLVKEEQ